MLPVSLLTKLRQLRGRRRLAPLVQAPYERMVGDTTYECYAAYRGTEAPTFQHPDSRPETDEMHEGCELVRLERLAPLSLAGSPHWVVFEPVARRGETPLRRGRSDLKEGRELQR